MSTYSPQYIAESFVKQYYEILCRSPADLHKFYLPDASFSFTETSQTAEIVSGTEQIRQRVAQLNLLGSSVDMSQGSVDAQRFEVTRILVVMNGTFSGQGSLTPRPFVNTFILVGTNNAFFVSNSVFRFLPSNATTPQPSIVPPAVVEVQSLLRNEMNQTSLSSQRNATEMLKSMIEVSNAGISQHSSTNSLTQVETSHHHDAVEAILQGDDEVHSEEQAEQPEVVDITPLEEEVPSYEEVTAAVDEVVDTQPVEEAVGGTKSYSDIVKRLAAKSAAAASTATPPGYRVVRSATVSQEPAKKAADVPSGSKQTTTSSGPQLFSVYVAPLSEPVTEAQIASLFAIFGKVAQVDIARGRKYGFVKFEEAAAMQAALAHTEPPIELNGVRLQIEEKTSPKFKGEMGAGRRRDRERDRDREGGADHRKNGEFKKEKEFSGEGGALKKEEGKEHRFRGERRFDKGKTNNGGSGSKFNKNIQAATLSKGPDSK